jgi:hypothetical protein
MKLPKIRDWRRRRPALRITNTAEVAIAEKTAGSASTRERSLAAVIASAFARAGLVLRMRVLRRLLAAVGPLALVVVGGGVFAKYLRQARCPEVPVSIDDAARASSAQVFELARYVEQSNPHVVAQVLDALARDTKVIAALGASLAALTVDRLAERGKRGPVRR